VASLGTPAAEHRCARLGFHPGKEPVGLRAVTAVWLKGTLRHLNRLLLNLFAVYATVSQYTRRASAAPSGRKEKELYARYSGREIARTKPAKSVAGSIFTRNGATKKNVQQSLETDSVFRATIKPAYQRRIPIHTGSSFGLRCRFSSRWDSKKLSEDLQQPVLHLTCPLGDGGLLLPSQSRLLFFRLSGQSGYFERRKLGIKSKKETTHVIRPNGDRRIELLGPHPGRA
jgi:hypothetical protein